jgi:hypothetical protein
VRLARCPLRPTAQDAHELVESYLDTQTFEGIPLTGSSVDDLDGRTYEAIRLIRAEHEFVRLAERREIAEHRRRLREGGGHAR